MEVGGGAEYGRLFKAGLRVRQNIFRVQAELEVA